MHGKEYTSDDKGDGPEATVIMITRDWTAYTIGQRRLTDEWSGTVTAVVPISDADYCARLKEMAPHLEAAAAPHPGAITLRTDADLCPDAAAAAETAAAAAAAGAASAVADRVRFLWCTISAAFAWATPAQVDAASGGGSGSGSGSGSGGGSGSGSGSGSAGRKRKSKVDMPLESARPPKKIDAVSLMMRNTTTLGSNFPSKVHGRQGSLGSFQFPPPGVPLGRSTECHLASRSLTKRSTTSCR